MSDRDRKPPFRRAGGKPSKKGGKSAGRPAWRDREAGADGPAILYGWHTVAAALANPKRQIRKLLADRERRAAAGGRKHRHPRDAGNRAPEADRPAARPGRRASGPAGGSRSPALAGYR